MPELPEVETVRRRLLTCLPGLLVRDVVVNDATVSEQGEAELRALLAGRRVRTLRRRGKYLIVDLEARRDDEAAGDAHAADHKRDPSIARRAGAGSGAVRPPAGPTVAVIHLRMTGQLLFRPEPGERPPRFTWLLDPGTELHFQDVRRFGRLWAFPPEGEDAFFEGMGPEPFSGAFSVAYLRGALEGRRAPLKAFLLDQRRVAGVGNIYADEALFRARLHPLRAAGSVGPREAQRLHAALLETLQDGIDHEGSSIESFVDPAGRRGSFQELLGVYQRTGQPCRLCGTTIRRLEVGGRGTHYCPSCQPRRGGMSPGSRRLRGSDVPPRGGKPADWEPPGR
jgi:formamidopyrimidine-DNA glycosylase